LNSHAGTLFFDWKVVQWNRENGRAAVVTVVGESLLQCNSKNCAERNVFCAKTAGT
jgi:hypothetical protein